MTIRNGRVSRRLGAAVLVALIGSLLAFASPSAALETEEAGTARLAGDNRYETAAAIATSPVWAAEDLDDETCSPDVVVVNGENFPDGLAASIYGDRILLVKANSVPAATEQAIKDLQTFSGTLGCGGQEVDLEVVGGPAAVSAEVVGQLIDITNGTGGYVDFNGRHYGADRYETAIAVAEDDESSPDCLVLAVGDNFPDALAAGPLVEDFECPLVLTAGDSLHPATAAYMAAEAADDLDFVYIIGGTAAIPASVETELFAMGLNTERLGGENRYETAAAIADALGSDFDTSAVLVNGNSFADALAASTFATLYAVQGPILLVNAGSIPSATAAWHVANCDSLGEDTGANLPDDGDPATDEDIFGTVFAIGGTAVISDDVLAGAGAATKCSDPIEVTSATISYENAQDQVCLVQNDLVLAEWTGPEDHDGPVLIPVPGSAADGLFPTITAVEIDGEGTAADEFPAEASFGEGTLNVDLGEDTDGMTQARFVEIWSSLPEAAATFTAVANSGPLFGPPLSGDSGVWVYCAAPSADVVFEMVFNQPVGDADDFGTTPYGVSADFVVDEEFACFEDSEFCEMFDIPLIFAILGNEFFGGGGFIDVLEEDGIDAFSASPLWGVGDADGNTVFTMTVSDVPSLIPWTAFAEECGGEEGSCETPFLAPGVVSNARGLVNECTWGELRASDAFTLSWTNIQSDEDCEFIFIE